LQWLFFSHEVDLFKSYESFEESKEIMSFLHIARLKSLGKLCSIRITAHTRQLLSQRQIVSIPHLLPSIWQRFRGSWIVRGKPQS